MTTALVKGQNIAWPDGVVTVVVHHTGDVSALLLGQDEKVRSSADLVFYNQPVSSAAAWRAGPPQQVRVDLAALDAGVERVSVVVSVDPGAPALGQQASPQVHLGGAAGTIATFTPTGLTTERALVVCEVYRRGGAWKVRAVGQGYDGGLAQALRAHGVDVDDAPEPPPATPGPATPPRPRAPAPQPVSPPPPGTAPQERLVRQMTGILEDASRSTASLRSTREYASSRLERALEHLVADPRTRTGPAGDAARAALERDHDQMVEAARANHARDMQHLRDELTAFEASLPPALARWDAPAWTSWQPVTESGAAVRIGTLGVQDAPGLAVPMVVGLPLHLPIWVDAATGGPHAAARAMRALATRVLAAAPPGALAVTVVDPGGTNPAPLPGAVPVSTDPAAVTAALTDLVRHVDLVEMAYQSGHPETLDEIDARPRLLLVHDVPTGLDDHSLVLLNQLVLRGAEHGVQVVLTGADSEAVPHPLVQTLLSSCRQVPCGTGGVLTDGFGGTTWDFTPDLGPDDPRAIDQVLERLARP